MSRWGAIAKSLPNVAPASRVFFVSKSQTWYGDFANEFPNDSFGVPRVYTTIKAALANCTASRGDVILVMPGHTESITNATDLNVNVAGVRIIGLSDQNGNRPVLTLNTATTAVVTVSAANCTIENISFDGTGFAAIVKMFSFTAAGIVFRNNKVLFASSTNQAGIAILTNSSCNDLLIQGNTFTDDGSATTGTTNVLQLVGGNNIQIRNNSFIGAFTTSLGAINNVTTACTNMIIDANTIFNETANSTKAIVLVAGSTGHISNNRMQILSGTAPITGAGMSWVGGNYYAAAIATAGTLI